MIRDTLAALALFGLTWVSLWAREQPNQCMTDMECEMQEYEAMEMNQ